MSTKVLRKEVYRTREVPVKDKLLIKCCDVCGNTFMRFQPKIPIHLQEGQLSGIFNCTATDTDGAGLGNTFRADICTFKCAHEFVEGAWTKIDRYAPFIAAEAKIERAELKLKLPTKRRKEIEEEWENEKER